VGDLVWGKDPEELLKLNEQKVAALGTEKKAAAEFFKNKAYTPSNQTRLIGALHAVKVTGCGAYVDTAEEAESEREVVFFTESAELLQRFHAKHPVVAILPDSKAVVAKTKDGRAVILLALDYVRWSEAFEKNLKEIQGRAQAEMGASRLELQMTGHASDRAKQAMKALGIPVVEHVPDTFGGPKVKASGAGG
jgi:glutamate racemase